MLNNQKDRRRDQILDAFIDLLTEKGYRNTSMLGVARKASASKETLYAWFSNKQGLFEAAIRRNAETVQTLLQKQQISGVSTEVALITFGSALLTLLLGEDSIAINRAAMSEASTDPELARVLMDTGRNATLPYFLNLLEEHQQSGHIKMDDTHLAAEQYLGLLAGDLQIRRLLDVLPEPSKKTIAKRASVATAAFLKLYAQTNNKT
ncbi:MAG: TetR/AcrR family transcriptional regulator [Sedimenticola sp.]|nr:TetR/AcrR family transcriptional regulator [Sedimenticola sp.]